MKKCYERKTNSLVFNNIIFILGLEILEQADLTLFKLIFNITPANRSPVLKPLRVRTYVKMAPTLTEPPLHWLRNSYETY